MLARTRGGMIVTVVTLVVFSVTIAVTVVVTITVLVAMPVTVVVEGLALMAIVEYVVTVGMEVLVEGFRRKPIAKPTMTATITMMPIPILDLLLTHHLLDDA